MNPWMSNSANPEHRNVKDSVKKPGTYVNGHAKTAECRTSPKERK